MLIAGLVLAGGRSRRMSQDKAFVELGGRPMICRAVDRLQRQTTKIAISANGDIGRYASLGHPVLTDTFSGFAGPLAGILAGLKWAEQEVPRPTHIATVAMDTPFMPQDLVAGLQRSATAQSIAVAASNGRLHPVFGLWPLSVADRIAAWLAEREERAVRAFLAECGYHSVAFDGLPDPFFNVNTPEDLDCARQRLESELA